MSASPRAAVLSLCALLALSALAPLLRAAELTVFAAASLSDSLAEAAPRFTAATRHTLRFNFGGSGALARQITERAPADVFISADELRLDRLTAAKHLLVETRRTLLANTLVLIVDIAPDGDAALSSLSELRSPAFRRIAIGDPATVPAGTYAKQYLEKLGLWEPVRAKLLPVDSVRGALAAVESGNADAGFVYKTDALGSKKVRIAFEVPLAEGPRIAYPAAVVADSKHTDAARALIAWLGAPEAQAVFAKHGFLPALSAAPAVVP